MALILDFERPIVELENKIEELRKFSNEKEIDLSGEIVTLEKKLQDLKENIYNNLSPWQKIQIARHPERPNAAEYIRHIFTNFIELHGDRFYRDDRAVIGGVCRFNGQPVTVVGHLKGKDTKENIARNFGMLHPEGNRKALRLMKQAEKFNRPVICFIDTPGAYPGEGAEERGQGEAIARNLMEMSQLKVPVIAIVIGEGGSGGALALGVGDHIMMLEHAVYSVITPEQFAEILYKDISKAQESAAMMKMTAGDLLGFGVIDEIITEPLGGAHKDIELTAGNIKDGITKALANIQELSGDELLSKRYQKFRSIGCHISG